MVQIRIQEAGMDLGNELKSCAIGRGADYFGVADLTLAEEFVRGQGGELVARYPRAIAIGIALQDSLVDLIPNRAEYAAAMLYKHNSYDIINTMLDQVAVEVANRIQRAGYRALPAPASKRASDEKIAGIISNKLPPHLAGLGWIGKSCLLVTPDHGPRVRWVTVLTDAPLEPTGTPMEERCGSCMQCTDACPVHAFTGRAFRADEPREARFDAAACERYFKEMEQKGGPAVCGMCLYICPYGRKNPKRDVQ